METPNNCLNSNTTDGNVGYIMLDFDNADNALSIYVSNTNDQ
jgi:hypothetical protein